MKLIEKKDDKIAFEASIDESLANAIRRYVLQIPIFAIEEAEISKNDSPLYDETIAHRIGLLPIKAEKSIDEKKAQLSLNVNKEGPVYSKDLKGNVKVAQEEMPLTFLNKNQEISLVAKGRIGKGSEHAKFSPGIMFYRNILEITIDKSLLEKIQKRFPEIKFKEKSGKMTILDNQRQEICDFCETLSKKNNKKIEILPQQELIISLESFGQLEVKDIFVKSIGALKKDLLELSKKIK